MRLSTLFRFLIGDRQAIHTIATTLHAIWIALLFVLTGGFARNYDKEPLFHEPQHIVGPLIVSALIGSGLFVVLYIPVKMRGLGGPGELRVYLIFMTLYWMTAPMAWLYGIPTERMTDVVTATELNLWTLGLVSVWRVLLIARVASVIFGAPLWMMLIFTAAYSNIVAVGVLVATPIPVINIMGGIELSQSEQLISAIALNVVLLSMITIPVLVLTSLVLLFYIKGSWQVPAATGDERPRVHPSVNVFTIAVLALWSAPLPLTQPAQSVRYTTERALKSGDLRGGIELMTANGIDAYPPYWDPPPRRLYDESSPNVLDVLESAVEEADAADWVVDRYTAKFTEARRTLLTPGEFVRFANIMMVAEAGPRLMYEHRIWVRDVMLADETENTRAARNALRDLAQQYAERNDLVWAW